MKLSEAVRPISYLKANAAKVIREIDEQQATFVITQHGEAKAVIQDIRSYEQDQENLALLKMLAQSRASMKQGKTQPVGQAFNRIRDQLVES